MVDWAGLLMFGAPSLAAIIVAMMLVWLFWNEGGR